MRDLLSLKDYLEALDIDFLDGYNTEEEIKLFLLKYHIKNKVPVLPERSHKSSYELGKTTWITKSRITFDKPCEDQSFTDITTIFKSTTSNEFYDTKTERFTKIKYEVIGWEEFHVMWWLARKGFLDYEEN